MADLAKLDGIASLEVPAKRDDLIRARIAIYASVPLQKLFGQAEQEGWDVDRLAGALADGISALKIEVDASVCRFLAEEFRARDKAKTLIVSTDTGLAVAQVPEDAIYVPDPVAREGTDKLATPLPRLKPEIEAAIIQHSYRVAAEPLLISQLEARHRSTELQRAEGDGRFHISTRSGRKRLADRIREELPELLKDPRGSMGRVFARCRINTPIPEASNLCIPLTLTARVSMLVADALAMNFRHDAFRWALDNIRARWGTTLAKAIAVAAHEGSSPQLVTLSDPWPAGLMIGSPDLAIKARHLEILALPDVAATVLSGSLYLAVKEDAYDFDAYELHARWCVDASVTVDVFVDRNALHPLVFTDLVESWLVGEVLQ